MIKSSFIASFGVAATASLLACAAVPVSAQQPTNNEAAATTPGSAARAAGKPSAERKYCIKDSLTGSRLTKKICKTKDEWAAQGVDPTEK